MYIADYHTHSNYSPDGADSIAALAQAAHNAGLSELAVTDHFDVGPFTYNAFDSEPRYRELLAAKEEYEGRLNVLFGIELGEAPHNPEKAADEISSGIYDFVIGSYHVLAGGEDFWAMVFPDARHCEGLLSRYLDELIGMSETCDFDVLGHLTYPLRYMNGREHMAVSFEPFLDKVQALFKLLIQSGKGIELNVSGLGTVWGQPMPDLRLLKLYRSLGGDIVTVGTDAHSAAKVGKNVRRGYELLREAGFTHITAFSERKPRYERIT